jgi:hypothetical protein
LIRALVLLVVAGRADGWHRLVTDHAGITTFQISSRGVEVVSVNVQEHLGLQLRSQV